MDTPSTQRYCVLRLYNADRGVEMQAIAERIREIVEDACGGECQIDVVDVLAEPERAAEDGVFLTPTLVRELPKPIRRVIGDLSEPGKTLTLLGILAGPCPGKAP